MFKLYSEPLDISPFLKELRDPSVGAFASFEGWVRDHHAGQEVRALEYEALAPLCESEADKIIREAKIEFGITNAVCLHRVGRLAVGEMSVWVGVSAPHRDEAFKACRYIIDELKKRLPIWKKEILSDGRAHWVNCQDEQAVTVSEDDYYSRQTILPEIGHDGQDKLKHSRVLVVGAGGLGSAALTSLSQAGVGTIGIVEFDKLHASNLHRQSLYTASDAGKNKIDLAVRKLKEINPFIKIEKYPLRLNTDNFKDVTAEFDIILDCTDNFAAKFLINDIAVLYKKTLIQASIYQFEGQVRVYAPFEKTACLRCLWPEMPSDKCIGNCAQTGVIGVVPSVMGHLQAWEAVKWILQLPGRLQHDVLIVNFKNYELNKIKHFPSAECPICSKQPSMTEIKKENDMSDYDESDFTLDIETIPPEEIKNYVFIDVREDMEIELSPVKNIQSINLPFSQFGDWDFDFAKDKEYLIFCAHGMRSLACVERLQDEGVTNVWSVNNGAEALQNYFASHPKAKS